MSLKGLMDSESLGLSCPECNRSIRATFGDARRNRTVRCSAGHSVKLDGRELDRSVRKIETTLGRLNGSGR